MEESDDFRRKNYSLIMARPDSPLAKYVNDKEHIQKYAEMMITESNEVIQDDEEFTLQFLNNNEITLETRVAYIKALEAMIQSLANVTLKDLWPILLQEDRVICSEENIIQYFLYADKTISIELSEFINRFEGKLDFASLKNKHGNEIASAFLQGVSKCMDLDNVHYKNILQSTKRHFLNFQIEDLDIDKIKILIDIEAIHMSKDTLEFMREYYPDNILHFIKHNVAEYATDDVFGSSVDFD